MASFIKSIRLYICIEKETKQPFQTEIEKLQGAEGSKYMEHKLQKEPSGSKELWMKRMRHEDSDHERCCQHINWDNTGSGRFKTRNRKRANIRCTES